MLVSVVVSTFNHGRFIASALDSVLRQQVDFDVEIIVGDDVSHDDTRDILRAYERANPGRIRLLLPAANLGGEGGGLFLALMEEARGDFIAILDGDDEWTDPAKLRKQVDLLLRHPECLLGFHNALVVYEDDKKPAHSLRADSDDCLFDISQMLEQTTVHNSTLMLRRELLDPQRAWLDGLTLFEISDWTIAVLAAKFGPVAYLGDALSLYRQHAGGWWSLSRRTEQLALTITQYEWLRAHLPAAHAPMIRLQIAQHALEMSREFEERRDFRGAALALSRCLAERPPEFEHYLPQEGCFGKTVWRKLVWRAAMYRCVGVNYLAWRLRPLAADLRWRWARRREGLRTRLRQAAGQSVGWIRLRSQPVDSHERGALRSAELHWGASGTPEVVVTIGAPGGAIFSRTGPSGGATTGPWVHEGMVFYLQDVSAGRPLTAANTLASVRAKHQLPRPAPAPTDGVKSTREPNGKGTAERLDLFEVSAAVGALLGRHVSAIRLVSTETECLVCEASFGSRIAIVKAGLSPDTSTIALEAWALERARAAGVPVPRVLAVDTSRRSFPGDVMVIDRAAGRPLPDLHLSPANRDRLLVEFGRCIRLLHGITLPGYGTLDESIYRSEGCVRGHFPHWRDSVHWHLDHGLPYLEARGLLGETAGRSIRDLTLRRADLLEDIPAPSLLHGDLAWGHVFVDDSDSQVTSLIDFGNRQTGDPAWEFARLSIAEGPSCFEAVFKGYDPEGELSDRFRDRVPFYRVMLGLAVGRWLHEHGYHRDAVDLTADIAAALPGLLDGVQPGSPA